MNITQIETMKALAAKYSEIMSMVDVLLLSGGANIDVTITVQTSPVTTQTCCLTVYDKDTLVDFLSESVEATRGQLTAAGVTGHMSVAQKKAQM